MMPTVKNPMSNYSESEAAHRLGVSIEQLRDLVQQHIVGGDTSATTPVSTFSSSDLVLLRFVSQQFTHSR